MQLGFGAAGAALEEPFAPRWCVTGSHAPHGIACQRTINPAISMQA